MLVIIGAILGVAMLLAMVAIWIVAFMGRPPR